jgi:DNA ligase-1
MQAVERHRMIKRRDAPISAGRKACGGNGKRDPFVIDAVLMYAQRGHGKRSSFYSDYTFGVWACRAGRDELVPVGKAYFGATDANWRRSTARSPQYRRPVRARCTQVARRPRRGPGVRGRVRRSAAIDPAQIRHRHAFSRINRLRWDKHRRAMPTAWKRCRPCSNAVPRAKEAGPRPSFCLRAMW